MEKTCKEVNIENVESEVVRLTNVSWEDVLFIHLLPGLSYKDCFNLRGVSKDFKNLVDSYFSQLKIVKGLTGLLQFKVVVAKTESVHELNLSDSSWLDDESFLKFCKQNENLTKVCLYQLERLTAAALHPLILNSAHLIELRLSPCTWINGGCLETLSVHAENLEVLELDSCIQLTDESIIRALGRFQKLRILEITNNKNITDFSLFTVAICCKQIEFLNFTGCDNLSFSGKEYLESCPQLQSILEPFRQN